MSNTSDKELVEGFAEWEYKGVPFLVCRTKENGLWHLSISHRSRDLTYEEIKAARYALLPDDVHMAMIFPPKAEFVNLHPYCFHLYQIKN